MIMTMVVGKRGNVENVGWTLQSIVGPVEPGTIWAKIVSAKKTGHKDEATFSNKMGGSTYYCKKQQG